MFHLSSCVTSSPPARPETGCASRRIDTSVYPRSVVGKVAGEFVVVGEEREREHRYIIGILTVRAVMEAFSIVSG